MSRLPVAISDSRSVTPQSCRVLNARTGILFLPHRRRVGPVRQAYGSGRPGPVWNRPSAVRPSCDYHSVNRPRDQGDRMVDVTLVTVHGFWSSPATWDRLCAVLQADEEIEGLRIHGFGYPSPKMRRLPFSWTRVPDSADIAQMLATEYATRLGRASSIAFVTHSQGGLILQRFLAWMTSEGRARELARIRTIIMLACPNGGSEYLASIRHVLGYGRHPQAADLEVLSKQVAETQRAVLARIVYASGVDDHRCRIPFHVYAAGSDAIVSAASAHAAFPGAGTLAGNHFTILDPAAPGNRTADIIKYHILTDLTEEPDASAQGAKPALPATLIEHSKTGVRLSRTQHVQVGDHDVPSSPPVADGVPQAPPSDPSERDQRLNGSRAEMPGETADLDGLDTAQFELMRMTAAVLGDLLSLLNELGRLPRPRDSDLYARKRQCLRRARDQLALVESKVSIATWPDVGWVAGFSTERANVQLYVSVAEKEPYPPSLTGEISDSDKKLRDAVTRLLQMLQRYSGLGS